MRDFEEQAVRMTMLARKTEDWSGEYAKDPKTYNRLLRVEAELRMSLTKYFRNLASDIVKRIRWQGYLNQRPTPGSTQEPNYNVQVLVEDLPMDQYDGTFIKVVFEPLAVMTAIGATAGENIYRVPLGIQSTDAIIQELTTEHVASLVGKKVAKDGSIIDNPKASYRISDKTRNDIAQSIKTSLNLGEDIQAATERLQKTISNPKRAKVIAETESVNAYQTGLMEFAKQSGAVGKESQDVGAVDNCRTYAEMGAVPLDYLYDDVYLKPTYHVKCRCGIRYIYQAEWDKIQASQETVLTRLSTLRLQPTG